MSAHFPNISKIAYEGPKSKNPLSFKHYNATEVVEGKTMHDHLRFSVVYWHTMCGQGADMFGGPTAIRPWEAGLTGLDLAKARVPVFFEIVEKLGAPYYAFHDRDVAPHAATLKESNQWLDTIVALLKEQQQRTGIKLLWGTSQLFAHARYAQGAATSPNAEAFAFAAAQVKKALEVTKELGGEGYTFWGGREGYSTLWNTDMKRELDHLAKFLHLAVDYAKQIGFKGQFYIEPKPKEPTKHQYDSDAAACLNFLREYDLLPYLKLNLETNHATLAGHSMQHEMEVAGAAGALGSIDANTGDLLLGWDTDQFPTDIYLTTQCMLSILKYGGTHHRRRELRLQGAPREHRPRGPFPCAHRRHGRLRPRPEDRRRHPCGWTPREIRQGPLRLLGQRPRREHRSRQGILRLAGKIRAGEGRSWRRGEWPAGVPGELDQRVHLRRL